MARPPAQTTPRRGIASMLAMLYLVLFSVLAVGFYAATITSTQVAQSDARVTRALLAAESGLDFVRYQMSILDLPYGTTAANLLSNVAARLAFNLNGSPNMNGSTVAVTAGAIHLPSATGWIALPGTHNPRFRATIVQLPATTTLAITIRGNTDQSSISRAVNMTFTPENATYALAGVQGINMGSSAYTDSYDSSKGSYNPLAAGSKGSIVSNGNITLNHTVTINGDARPGVGRTLLLRDSSVVTGRKSPLSANISFPSVTLPPAGTYTSLGTVNTTSGTQNLPGGVYVIDHLTLGGTAVVNWQGPVTLYIRYSYNVSGSVVINTYQNRPANRKIYFLPSCTTANWSGTNVCVGELYAPDTDFTISGSVSKFGRITAKTITNSSTGGMHADESLPVPGGAGDYLPVADSYAELP